MNVHRLFGLLGLLSLLLITRAYAGGAYQWTEDRKKARVWNNDPKPVDRASWSGKSDEQGYATGPGTLSWYKIDPGFMTGSNIAIGRKKTLISSYSGAMVRGKFSGTVTTVDHGKTYHANFADGQRKGRWISGPAVSKAESAEPETVVKKAQAVESERSTASELPVTGETNVEKAAGSTQETTADIPAAGPEGTEVGSQKSEVSEPASKPKAEQTQKPSQSLIAKAEESEESTTAREPITRKNALAPGAVRAIEKPAGAPPKKSDIVRSKSEKMEPAQPKSTASKPAELDLTEQIPAEGPDPETKSKTLEPPVLKSDRPAPESSPPSAKETDDSIRTLVGPPPALRSAPKSETNPPAEAPSPASAAPDGPKLTAVEAMDIADIEARTRGYDLGEYQLPKAEYNTTTDTWSVSYAGREADKSKRLSVTVQDKTGKAEVKK